MAYRNKHNTSEWIVLITFTIALFIIHVWYVKDMYLIYVLDDEFGYWSIAAYLAGIDWSSSTSHIAYYSYGYSILLTPIFWFFDDPIKMYRAALVLNSILLSCIPIIAYDIVKRIFTKNNWVFLVSASFCASLYSSYVVYANIAWSESLLIFLCWLLLWVFIRLNSTSHTWKFLLLGFLLVYAYTVHQRTLGVLLAGIIVVITMKAFRYINWRQFLGFISSIVVFFVAHGYIKSNIIANVWRNAVTSTNDYSGQFQKIASFFSLEGLIKTLQVLSGQLFYVGAASFILAFIGIYSISKMIIRLRIEKHNDGTENNFSSYFNALVFLLIAFIFTFGISVVFMNNANRVDHILYGRYIDMLIGPLLLIGIISLFNFSKIEKSLSTIISLILLVLTGIFANYGINQLEHPSFNGITVIGIKQYYISGIFQFKFAILISGFCALVCCISFAAKKYKWIPFIGLSLLSILFLHAGVRIISNDLAPSHQKNLNSNNIVKYIKDDKELRPIYFLIENNFNIDRNKGFFQFLLMDRKLISLTEEDLGQINGQKYIITSNPNPLLFPYKNEYSLIYASGSNYLWSNAPEFSQEKNVFNLPLSLFYSINGVRSIGEIEYIDSDGSSNYLLYGPYMELNQGKYNISGSFELLSESKGEIGYFEVVSGGTILDRQIIIGDSFDKRQLKMDLSINLNQSVGNIEFRVFTNEGALLRIKSIKLIEN
ncbi:hypothetical protein [Bacillus sp. FSL K6-6540]|uniref:hypothetical protein n=1 Tax=Bacillus sp. FSL K6-6540 TaxID=2921512 RepID=UPI0030F827A3